MHRALIAIPVVGAAAAAVIPSDRVRPALVPVVGAAHLGMTIYTLYQRQPIGEGDWLGLDALGSLILGLVSLLFFLCSLYAPAYLRTRGDRPNRVICLCLMAYLGTASLLILSQHLGLMWVAVEGTTLATAPLIYFNRNARSIEATWKFLMVGSVGIAIALLGSLFLSYSAHLGGTDSSLLFRSMVANSRHFSVPWLRAAFVFLLVGYGTKMGLAPLHTWKPDAYGEAPGLAGALLAGGVTSAAFLALLRVYSIVNAAGEGAFARGLLLVMGLVSMAWAAVFLVRQRDYKRMLAYSSVEHMGILVLGVGLGGAGVWAALFHTVNNALTKGVLFLAAGNIHRAYGSKSADHVSGVLRRLPISGALFLAAFFAVTGSPPFGPFISELTILNTAIAKGNYVVAGLFVLFLAAVFIGMGATVLGVMQGAPSEEALSTRYRDSFRNTAPIVIALLLVLGLGVWIPRQLAATLDEAVIGLEAQP